MNRRMRADHTEFRHRPLRLKGLAVAVLVLAACMVDRPSTEAWVEQRWHPMVELVPEPAEADRALCDRRLGLLREAAADLDPAPSGELRDAAQGWVRRAESLMFSCASDPELDYASEYEQLRLLEAEVEVLLGGS